MRDRDVADQAAVFICERAAGADDMHAFAALGRPPAANRKRIATAQPREPGLPFILADLFQRECAHRAADRFLGAVAEDGFRTGVPGHDHAIEIARDDRIARLTDHAFEHAGTAFAFGERTLLFAHDFFGTAHRQHQEDVEGEHAEGEHAGDADLFAARGGKFA